MLPSTRPLGLRSTPEFAIPAYNDWRSELRVVNVNDTDLTAIPAEERINLDIEGEKRGSRFGLNTITLLVKISGSAVVSLYAKTDTDFYLVRSDEVADNVMLTYKDLPPLCYVPVITSLSADGTITLQGGGTF